MSSSVSSQRFWFLSGQASWFVAFGLQAVLFPFLVVHVMQESPERVGIAQMCLMAPALVLLIPGGMLADVSDLRRLLTTLQCIAIAAPLLLAVAIGTSNADFSTLLLFALIHGGVQAMVVPARDALLSRIANNNIQHTITTVMGLQFICQILGFVVASGASLIGATALLCAQAALYGIGALCAYRLPPARPLVPMGHEAYRGTRTELGHAFRDVVHSARIGPIMLVMVGVGFIFIAVFSVVIPLMVRDLYQGDSVGLALINGAFVAGVLIATTSLSRRPPVVNQGRTIYTAAWGGAILTTLFAIHPHVVVFYLLILLFGVLAGVVMSLGRTVVQETAKPNLRARTLAIYSLGFLGSAPIGSLIVGQIASVTGILPAATLGGALMMVLLCYVGYFTPILRIRRPHQTRVK